MSDDKTRNTQVVAPPPKERTLIVDGKPVPHTFANEKPEPAAVSVDSTTKPEASNG